MSPLLVLLACAPKLPEAPTLMPYYSLAAAPHRDLPFQTENEAVELVRATLVRAGLPEAAQIQVSYSEQATFPHWMPGDKPAVVISRFLVSPDRVREHLDELAELLNMGTMKGLEGWSESDLESAYLAFFVGGLAREMANGVAWKRRAGDYEEAWTEEQRVRTVEWSVLSTLAAEGKLPANWPSLWRRFEQTLLDSLPADQVQHPSDVEGQRSVFAYGHDSLQSPYPGDSTMITAVAMDCQASLDISAAAAPALDSLPALFGRSPTRVRDVLKRSMNSNLGNTATLDGERLKAAIDDRHYTVEVDEAGDRFRVELDIAFQPAAAHTADLWKLINGFYQSDWRAAAHDYRMSLEKGNLVIRAPWVGLTPTGSPGEPDEVLAQMDTLAPTWLKGFIKVNSGLSSADDVLSAISQGNEP